MATRLNPYIQFADTAESAMTFYQSVLGGELTVSHFADFPGGEGATGVMHAQLETDAGYTIMASDTPPGMERTEGASISISLSGDDADQLRGYWDGLAADGQVVVPLEKQMWGDEFGQLVDRFGVAWMVNIAGS